MSVVSSLCELSCGSTSSYEPKLTGHTPACLSACLPAAGATGGVAAAVALLGEVMPAALGASLEEFLAAVEGRGDAEVAAEAGELRWVALW